MVPRLFIFVVAVWALQALPGLCIAGALTHLCSSHLALEPAKPCHDGEPNDGGHESDCTQDPCNALTLRQERSNPSEILDSTIATAAQTIESHTATAPFEPSDSTFDSAPLLFPLGNSRGVPRLLI